MNKYLEKRILRLVSVILSFILGCIFTSALIPLDRTCKIDDSDREYNIMKNSKFKTPDLIVLILSAPTNFEKRSVIRDTWLKLRAAEESEFTYKHYFVIGTAYLPSHVQKRLNNEQIQQNDVLLLPMEDSYANLTDKIKLSFHWLNTQFDYGLVFKYVFKCDDDSFVNLNELVLCLSSLETDVVEGKLTGYIEENVANQIISTNYQNSGTSRKVYLYWGYFNGNAKVKTKGKWKESNWIASDRYLPYALGGGYLLSKELVSYIGRNNEHLKSFNSEDISVGLWLSPINGIYRIHDVRFDTEWTSRGCSNNQLVKHNILPSEMLQLYRNILKTGKLCSKETSHRSHYVYNWNVPPSTCCKTV
ncbi:unnamed protein product [Phyllotreta striolata]|uniref:Hexosyltransferase n=1 Tax=Phyllotreta striolata TaxID=444603 RepID=A0A9N9TVB2_PHYSR|nr:unnamed protein product [Phyllotreta striolata]